MVRRPGTRRARCSGPGNSTRRLLNTQHCFHVCPQRRSPPSWASGPPRCGPRWSCWGRGTPSPSSPATGRRPPGSWTRCSSATCATATSTWWSWRSAARAILASIEEQGKLTPELRAALERAQTKAELEDLYRPYKPKRRTRATIAQERGLGPLAELIWAGRDDRRGAAPAGARPFVDAEKEVASAGGRAGRRARHPGRAGLGRRAGARAFVRDLTRREGRAGEPRRAREGGGDLQVPGLLRLLRAAEEHPGAPGAGRSGAARRRSSSPRASPRPRRRSSRGCGSGCVARVARARSRWSGWSRTPTGG